MEYGVLLLGLAVGAAAGWAVGRAFSGRSARDEAVLLKERLAATERASAELRDARDRLAAEAQSLQKELAEEKTAAAKDRQASDEKLTLLDEARKNLRLEFENLANRIFDDKSARFVGENRERLAEILNPFKTQLGEFRAKVETIHTEGEKERVKLISEIQHLRELNNRICKEADDLTQALKGESKTRGNWGEVILDRILESSGLTPELEYETQMALRDKYQRDARKLPDVIVHLPDQRDVIIDSKVALVDYLEYSHAEDEENRNRALKAHLDAVRGHVSGLSAKNYQDLEGIQPLEMVIMFIPNESAYVAAMRGDDKLYEDAFRKHVHIVGPNTLLLTLKLIATMWRSDKQNRNALAIAERGKMLYEKFANFVGDFEEVSQAVSKAGEKCGEARKKLSEGRGNLVWQAEKLIDLGVKASKTLPGDLRETAGASEENE